jgi:Na+-translocating ferredoxin:NAD+ oxidoreductase RnfG subunit
LYFFICKGGGAIKNIKLVVGLMIVCLLSSCGTKIDKEVQEVIKEDCTVERLKKYENESIYRIYHVTDSENNKIIQLIEQNGFVDKIKMMVVIDCKEDEIEQIKILEHNESHDYGDLLTEEWFLERFKGKTATIPLRVVKMSAKEENQIVAITGATITSEAVAKGANLCMNNYQKIKGE